MNDAGMSSHDVVDRAGVTYRQLSYWCSEGAITPSVDDGSGPGRRFRWSNADADALAGIARVARDLATLQGGTPAMPLDLVARLWLECHAAAGQPIRIVVGTITITLR